MNPPFLISAVSEDWLQITSPAVSQLKPSTMEVISLTAHALGWAGSRTAGWCPAPLRLFSTLRLKDLFYRSSNLQYFKRLIQIPQLPEVSVPGSTIGAAGARVLSEICKPGVTQCEGVSSIFRTHPTSYGPLRYQNTSALWWSSQLRPHPQTVSRYWRRMTSWTWMPPSR